MRYRRKAVLGLGFWGFFRFLGLLGAVCNARCCCCCGGVLRRIGHENGPCFSHGKRSDTIARISFAALALYCHYHPAACSPSAPTWLTPLQHLEHNRAAK